jgi:hypothetical protein
VENALHPFRKDVRHGVLSALVVACHEARDSGTVGPKFAPEEMIHEEHLACKKKQTAEVLSDTPHKHAEL